MKHIDLFSGIGGFALAAEMVWPNVEHIFCDNEPFAQAVLRKHWPNAPIHGDIRHFRGEPADIITGGFPCQPFSAAGLRRGKEDDRHLWPEMLRVIRESHPRWVVGENVGGLLTWNGGLVLDEVYADLEGAGYEVWSFVIPAAAVNAPHRRDRVWIVAHAISDAPRGSHRPEVGQSVRGRQNAHVGKGSKVWSNASNRNLQNRAVAYATSSRDGGSRQQQTTRQRGKFDRVGGDQGADWTQDWFEVASELCRVDDGLPKELDKSKRLKALGNAIVPQVAAEIMRAIKEIDEAHKEIQPAQVA